MGDKNTKKKRKKRLIDKKLFNKLTDELLQIWKKYDLDEEDLLIFLWVNYEMAKATIMNRTVDKALNWLASQLRKDKVGGYVG